MNTNGTETTCTRRIKKRGEVYKDKIIMLENDSIYNAKEIL